MSRSDSFESSQGSEASSSQDSLYGSSTERKPASQEIENDIKWRARQLLCDITEESTEMNFHHKILDFKSKTTEATQHTFASTKSGVPVVAVQGKANDEIIKRRESRRNQTENTAQGPELGGTMAGSAAPRIIGETCRDCHMDKTVCTCDKKGKRGESEDT